MLELHGGRTLLLYDILYALGIQRNLVHISILLGLGYILNFHDRCIVYYGYVYHGAGHLLNGFFLLNYDYYGSGYANSYFFLISSSRMLIWM